MHSPCVYEHIQANPAEDAMAGPAADLLCGFSTGKSDDHNQSYTFILHLFTWETYVRAAM